MMRAIVLGSLLVIMHSLESTLFQYIRIGGIGPNFMIMIIVSFALLRGSKEGMIIGAFSGLLYDEDDIEPRVKAEEEIKEYQTTLAEKALKESDLSK